MLEPKFQCWDREYQHMYHNAWPFEHLVYVEMSRDDPEVQQRKSSMEKVNGKWFYFLQRKDVDLRQWIGLKDRNGQEIYSGDIIGDNPDGLFKSIVKCGIADIGATTFDDKHFPSWAIGFYAEYDGEPDREMTNLLSQGNVIVISNIYEHPELLKQQRMQ